MLSPKHSKGSCFLCIQQLLSEVEAQWCNLLLQCCCNFNCSKSSFNIVGQWAVTTSIDFSLAQLIQVIILLSIGGKTRGGYEALKYVVIAFHGGILLLHAILNSLPISLLSFFGQLAEPGMY